MLLRIAAALCNLGHAVIASYSSNIEPIGHHSAKQSEGRAVNELAMIMLQIEAKKISLGDIHTRDLYCIAESSRRDLREPSTKSLTEMGLCKSLKDFYAKYNSRISEIYEERIKLRLSLRSRLLQELTEGRFSHTTTEQKKLKHTLMLIEEFIWGKPRINTKDSANDFTAEDYERGIVQMDKSAMEAVVKYCLGRFLLPSYSSTTRANIDAIISKAVYKYCIFLGANDPSMTNRITRKVALEIEKLMIISAMHRQLNAKINASLTGNLNNQLLHG